MQSNSYQQEIERQFLIRDLPDDLEQHPFVLIKQGYLSVSETREIRVRSANEVCTLTIKDGQGTARGEVEIPVTRDQFAALWPATGEQRLEKIRYDYPLEQGTVQIDCYQGAFTGFNVLEVEFDSISESDAFNPPGFCGEEITEHGSFYYLKKLLSESGR